MMPTFPPPKMPYGGFSPVRFQGRYIRRCLPVDYKFVASRGLPPSFVHLATCNAASSLGVEGRGRRVHYRSNVGKPNFGFDYGSLSLRPVDLSSSSWS